MRHLLSVWGQELTPLSADEAVQQILDHAEFLWHPSFRASRSALAALHRWKGDEQLWVAGPEWFRKPLLEACRSLADLEARLASDDAESMWRGNRRDPKEMLAQGRWRAAVAAWRSRPRETPEERLDFARALFAVGRFKEALGELHRLRRPEARVMRIRCLHRLGELRKAARNLQQLETAELAAAHVLEAAAVATRVYGNLGETSRAGAWARRAVTEVESTEHQNRSELLNFAVAWDQGETLQMVESLDRARPALDIEGLAWRWHKSRGQEAIGRGAGEDAVTSLGAALRSCRRRLTPLEAGDLWNEMAVGRSLCGDLIGAERALLHTLRLHREVEGPQKTTLALFNLAEIRLRRGRLSGVREILELSARENRLAGNWRGIVHDVELWARYDLVRGRPSAALERLQKAQAEFDARGVLWRRPQLRAIGARAFGWLGRPHEASVELRAAGGEVLAEFEPEERPAVWALAGDRERALEEVVRDDLSAPIWKAVLTGREATAADWRKLDFPDDYRFARLIFDLDAVEKGSVPGNLVHRAATIFRRLDAGVLAERLERGETGSWTAVGRYLERGSTDAESLGRLFRESGHGEVRLVRRGGGEVEEVLLDGAGGPAGLSSPVGSAELVLTTSWIDPVVRALFNLIVRDLGARSRSSSERVAPRSRPFGMVGESRALAAAMDKLGQLAPEDVPILLLGETGTGKELAARRAHLMSSRPGGPFLPLNCAAVSEELLMSDLFGHVRGAYTGAVRDRVGVFEAAREGTVFLDEIGDLPLRAQGFLLRVLQEGEIRRVGETTARSTDVRVIAATHRDLEEMVRTGIFRADLYYRLRVASIRLPPLRDRGSDVILLAEHFLRRLRPSSPPRIGEAARNALLRHGWPGNVRELENVLSVAVPMAGSETLGPEDLDLPYRGAKPKCGYHEDVLNFRRRLVGDALVASGGNRAEAARALGLTRQALSYLVRRLEIDG
jgi:two-component system NtrC family response regulator